ncbi:unnamed protein product [Candida parapsilosis]
MILIVSVLVAAAVHRRGEREIPRMYLVTSSVPGVKFPFEAEQEDTKKEREDQSSKNKLNKNKREKLHQNQKMLLRMPTNESTAYYTTIYLSEMPDGTNLPAPAVPVQALLGIWLRLKHSYVLWLINTGNSDTFKRNDTGSFQIQYADGTFATGIWGHDTVRIGDISVPDLSFAIANETSSDIGVLVLDYSVWKTTTSFGYMYENLPMKMKSDGVLTCFVLIVFGFKSMSIVDHFCLELLTMLNTKVLWKSSPC